MGAIAPAPALALAGLCLVLAGCGPPHATPGPAVAARSCLVSEVPDPGQPAGGMVWIPGGSVRMGADDMHPEEAPVRNVSVAGFWMAAHEVTNRQFAAFVSATGYRTLAERTDPSGTGAVGGGAVFAPGLHGHDWSDLSAWWRLDMTATWRRPDGSDQRAAPGPDEPVVQIAYQDALAFALWRGHQLPDEAQWERAARGGLEGARYVWGQQPRPGGRILANHWQGVFPVEDTADDGYAGRAPVGCFTPNGYGLYDMAGNVWEWTRDAWSVAAAAGGPAAGTGVPGLRVIKGGSFLCSDRFCHRYRPAARQPGDETFSTAHLGFRTIWIGSGPPAGPAPSSR